jgi:hypothetical protein
MKNLVAIILTMCFVSVNSFAQQKLTEGTHEMKRNVFKINKLNNWDIVLEENSKINLDGKYEGNPWLTLENVVYISKDDVKSAFVKVIGRKRLSQLPPKGLLSIILIFDKMGKPSEVSYYLPQDVGLTLDELDRLNAYIKDNIGVKIPDLPANKQAIFGYKVIIGRILDGSL